MSEAPRHLPEGIDQDLAQSFVVLLYQQSGPLAVALFDYFLDRTPVKYIRFFPPGSSKEESELEGNEIYGRINTICAITGPKVYKKLYADAREVPLEYTGDVIYKYHGEDGGFEATTRWGWVTMGIPDVDEYAIYEVGPGGLHGRYPDSGEFGF